MQASRVKIAYLSKEQKIWFIRASSGTYAKNFRHGGVIAINHLEEALGESLGTELPKEDEIKSALLKNEKYSEFIEDPKTRKSTKKLNRTGLALLGQIKRFANDIEAGDLIVTKNANDGYDVGICADSGAFIDHDPIEIPSVSEDRPKEKILRYKFRKKVTWGPTIDQKDLPHSVRRATRGHQTVSNLSNHSAGIFHLIYPFFTDGEHLFFSNKIRKEGDINARVVGKLFENISLAEKLIQTLTLEEDLDLTKILQQLNELFFSDSSSVTCKAEFMSPGDLWCKVPLSQKEFVSQLAVGVLVCLLLTGQASASSVGALNQDAVAELKVNPKSPTTPMFEEKFQAAEPSTALQGIAKTLKSKLTQIGELEEQRSTKEIQEYLNLDLTSMNTSKLEQFEYGINIIELRRLNENY